MNKVIPAELKHLDMLVRCHVQSFSDEFMTLIGSRLIRGFYKYYITCKEAIVFVVVNDSGEVIGLVAGGEPGLREKFSVRRVPFYFPDIIIRVISNHYVRRRFFQHFGRLIRKIGFRLHIVSADPKIDDPAPDETGTWSSLLLICTNPDCRGQGIGSMLMDAFRKESKLRGYKTMRLSVRHGNDTAMNLYKKCGWEAIFENPRGVYFKRDVED